MQYKQYKQFCRQGMHLANVNVSHGLCEPCLTIVPIIIAIIITAHGIGKVVRYGVPLLLTVGYVVAVMLVSTPTAFLV